MSTILGMVILCHTTLSPHRPLYPSHCTPTPYMNQTTPGTYLMNLRNRPPLDMFCKGAPTPRKPPVDSNKKTIFPCPTPSPSPFHENHGLFDRLQGVLIQGLQSRSDRNSTRWIADPRVGAASGAWSVEGRGIGLENTNMCKLK